MASFRIVLILAFLPRFLGQKDLDISFLRDYLVFDPNPKVLTSFLRWKPNEKLDLLKVLSLEGFRSTIIDPELFEYEEPGNWNEIYPVQDLRKYKPLNVILEERQGIRKDYNLEPKQSEIINTSFFIDFEDLEQNKTKKSKPKPYKNIPVFVPLEYNFFILDFDCPSSVEILKIAMKQRLFSAPYKWLVLTTDMPKLFKFIKSLYILSDSYFFIAQKEQGPEEDYIVLWDAYRIDRYNPVVLKVVNRWSKHGFDNYKHRVLSKERKNLQGKSISMSNHIQFNDSFFHLNDYRNTLMDPVGKYNHIIETMEVDYVNGTPLYYFAESWDSYNFQTKKKTIGVLTELQAGRCEIGSAFVLLAHRMQVAEFMPLNIEGRGTFIMRKPPLSYVSNIFTLPFSRSVWICSFLLMIVIAGVFYLTVHVEWLKMDEYQEGALEDSFMEVAMLTVGAFCIQGSPRQPRGVGSRTAMFVGFVALMFLYVAYSANIITLLQSSADSINTYQDLLESRIELGTENMSTYIHFMKIESDPVKKLVFDKKIAPPGERPHFENVSHGLERVRTDFYAFFTSLGPAYGYISDTYTEEEKCGLNTIDFLSAQKPIYTIRKNSDLKEIFRVALRKIGDYGLSTRDMHRIYGQKPECFVRGSIFSSVGLIDVYGAYLTLIAGAILSIVILLLELLHHHCFKMKCCKL